MRESKGKGKGKGKDKLKQIHELDYLPNRKIIDMYRSEMIQFMEYERDKFVLRIESNGDIFYKGELLDTEEEVATGLLVLSRVIQDYYNHK